MRNDLGKLVVTLSRRTSEKLLKKVLRANVGRPWDAVYSELCDAVRSPYERHQLNRWISWNVSINNIYVGADKKVYQYQAGVLDETKKWEYDRVTHRPQLVDDPNGQLWLAVDTPVRGFYVHPTTQLLCEAKQRGHVWLFPHVAHRGTRQERETIQLNKNEWYKLEECGRSPKARFKAWFYYKTSETVTGRWEPLDALIAKGGYYRFSTIWKMDVNPFRKFPDGRLNNEMPELIPFIWKERHETHTIKRSVNRKQMAEIRKVLAKKLDRKS